MEVSTAYQLKSPKRGDRECLRSIVAHEVLHQHIYNLEQDLAASYILRGSLGSAVWSHERVLTATGRMHKESAAFRLALPGLENVPLRDLILLRQSERDAFDAFRSALRKTIHEVTRSGDAKTVEQAVRDLVKPELAKIELRLRTAKRAFARKSALSVAIGAVVVTCGTWLGAPLPTMVGLGSLLPVVAAAGAKYLDEKQTVEMSNMFFLWKALQHAERSHA